MLLSLVLEMDNADALGDVRGLTESFDSVLRSCAKVREAVDAPEMELTIVVGQHPHLITDELLVPRATGSGLFSRVIVLFAAKTTYYEKKMLGVIHSRGDLISFIDSDVTYSEPWLGMMLDAWSDGCCDVTYGCTYARLGTPAENAAALAWQFAVNDPRDHRYATTGMRWSNNWIARRDFLLEHPIPRVSGDLKVEGSFWDVLVEAQGARVRFVATEAFHAQPATVRELAALMHRSGRGAVVGARKDRRSLWPLVMRLLRHNGIRMALQRSRALRRGPGSAPPYSIRRVLGLVVSSQVAYGLGIVREAMHPLRPASADYSGLRPEVHHV